MRFVSTPEVLERFVTLEKEIVQIEKSIHSNELQNNDTLEGNFDATGVGKAFCFLFLIEMTDSAMIDRLKRVQRCHACQGTRWFLK